MQKQFKKKTNYIKETNFEIVQNYLDELGFFVDSSPDHLQFLTEEHIKTIAQNLKPILHNQFLQYLGYKR